VENFFNKLKMIRVLKESYKYFLHRICNLLIDDLTGQFAKFDIYGMPYVWTVSYRARIKALHVTFW